MCIAQMCLTLCDPIGCSPAGSFMGFSRQEHCSGLPFPSPGDLPNPGMEPRFPAVQADSLPSAPPGKTLICILADSYMEYGVKILLQSTQQKSSLLLATTRESLHKRNAVQPKINKMEKERNVTWIPASTVPLSLLHQPGSSPCPLSPSQRCLTRLSVTRNDCPHQQAFNIYQKP